MINLLKQLPEDIVVIPQKIELESGPLNTGKQKESINGNTVSDHYKKAGKIFELSKKSLKDYFKHHHYSNEFSFPEITIQLTPEITAGYNNIIVLTEIQVFGEERLVFNESGLTIPLTLKDIEPSGEKDITVTLQHKINEQPGLFCRFI